MPPSTNPIDLTTVANVKSYALAQGPGSGDDQLIQDCITAFGAYVLTRTGRGPRDGSIPTSSPLVTPVDYVEVYDGNGSKKLFLRNAPIQSVVSLSINGVAIQLSTAYGQPGYLINGDKKCIVLRGSAGGSGGSFTTTGFGFFSGGQSFVCGLQNIAIEYTAGYNGVPFDLEMTARKVVSLNYKRKGWIGQKSQSMAQGAGTISYGTWEMDADCERTIESYKRRAMV